MQYSSRKYRRLVEWIAGNDNAGEPDTVQEIAGYLSVVMVAHCYDLKPQQVALDVVAMRAALLPKGE